MWRDATMRRARAEMPKQDPFDYEISLDHVMNCSELDEHISEHLWIDIGD